MSQTQTSIKRPSMDQVLEHLQNDLGIRFVAFDFDQTILSIHTGGYWMGTSQELQHHVRTEMKDLIPNIVMKQRGMHMAVVTFSSQPIMVQQIVEGILVETEEIISGQDKPLIPIRAEDGSWTMPSPCHRGEDWWHDIDDESDENNDTEGKQPHMVSAIQQLEAAIPGLEISKSSTVLIDDDEDNIRIARENGVRGVWLNPDRPDRLLWDLYKLS